MFAQAASAAPVQARGSISARVQSQTELCETLGGGKISVSYSYENGKMVSAQTSCKGGSEGGRVCINDATTTDCYKVQEHQTIRDVPGDVGSMPVFEAQTATSISGVPVQDTPALEPVATPEPTQPSGEQQPVPDPSPSPVLVPLS